MPMGCHFSASRSPRTAPVVLRQTPHTGPGGNEDWMFYAPLRSHCRCCGRLYSEFYSDLGSDIDSGYTSTSRSYSLLYTPSFSSQRSSHFSSPTPLSLRLHPRLFSHRNFDAEYDTDCDSRYSSPCSSRHSSEQLSEPRYFPPIQTSPFPRHVRSELLSPLDDLDNYYVD